MLIAERHELPVAMGPVPAVNDLVRIAADTEPDCGDYGPELVLGPWADLSLDPSVRRVAVAWCAWIPPIEARAADDAYSPIERAMRDRTVSARRRSALHAVARAPTALYNLTPTEGGRYVARGDTLRLGPTCPDDVVTLTDPIASVTGDVGPWVMARAARGPTGWALVAPIAVTPWDDEAEHLEAWTSIAAAAHALDPSIRTYADAARWCGHLWARLLLTKTWERHG